MSNRVLAFIVCLPIAGAIGFAAGRATAPVGTVMRADAPGASGAHVRVDRRFSLGPVDERVVLAAGGEEIELLRLDETTGRVEEMAWAPDGSLAGVVVNGAKLVVIDAAARRVMYELPLVEKLDGSRAARGLGFSANALAITFDDCPRAGAGCRPRFMALPTR
jgi:hypothetical protein